MAKELKLQGDIRLSVIKDGGYGVKLSNRFTVGIPDLYLGLAPFAPVIVEVKDFGVCTRMFDRQVEVTPLQAETMRRMSEQYETMDTFADGPVTFVLVGWQRGAGTRDFNLTILPRDVKRFAERDVTENNTVRRGIGGYYDIAHLMRLFGVPKIV